MFLFPCTRFSFKSGELKPHSSQHKEKGKPEQESPELAASSREMSWALSLPPVSDELFLQQGFLQVPSPQLALEGNIPAAFSAPLGSTAEMDGANEHVHRLDGSGAGRPGSK